MLHSGKELVYILHMPIFCEANLERDGLINLVEEISRQWPGFSF